MHSSVSGGLFLLADRRGRDGSVYHRSPDHPHRPERQPSPQVQPLLLWGTAGRLTGSPEEPGTGGMNNFPVQSFFNGSVMVHQKNLILEV